MGQHKAKMITLSSGFLRYVNVMTSVVQRMVEGG